MYFDTSVVKYEHHNVAYNDETKELRLGPVTKIIVEEGEFISISLAKWCIENPPNKGKYIAFLALSDIPDAENIMQTFVKDYDEDPQNIIANIQNGTYTKNIHVFKFSVNSWRAVEMKKKKWCFIYSKPTKEQHSNIQRLLQA